MDTSKALSRVHSLIRGNLEHEMRSPTLVRIFQEQIDGSLDDLRQQFRRARENGIETTVWPKMITGYAANGDGSLIWGPIRDELGRTLGLKFMPNTQGGERRRPRVHMEWHRS